MLLRLFAGRTVAASADLSGEEIPALFTVGKDGAVFYWMYEAAPPNTNHTAAGYADVPGKHRKRKASDMDPAQPAAAIVSAEGPEAPDPTNTHATTGASSSDSGGGGSGDSSLDGSSDGSSDSDSASGAKEANENVPKAAKASQAGSGEDDVEEVLASTSGRENDAQQQSVSFAGEQHSALQGVMHVPGFW